MREFFISFCSMQAYSFGYIIEPNVYAKLTELYTLASAKYFIENDVKLVHTKCESHFQHVIIPYWSFMRPIFDILL